MSREQTAIRPDYVTCGPHLSGWLVSLSFSTRKDAQDAHEIIARHGIAAPTVSGGEGWEELERQIGILRRAAKVPVPDDDRDFDIEKARRGAASWRTMAENTVSAFDALIAVARGGGALREQARFVPTAYAVVVPDAVQEDHLPLGLALELLADSEDMAVYAGEGSANVAYVARQCLAALGQAATSDAEQVGTSVASEPNPLPTVQAETAVVGWRGWPRKFADARYEIALRPDQQASLCPFCENHIDTSCDVTILGGEYLTLAHTACLPDECRAAINAGEQPGMSEEPFGYGFTVRLKDGTSERVSPALHEWIEDWTAQHNRAPTLPDDLLSLSEALEPFALISSEGLVTGADGFVTITTQAEYFHRAAEAIRTLAAKQGGKSNAPATLAKDRWPDLTVAEVEAMRRDANSQAGYSRAFYEVAEMLGLPAMPKSPREAWEDDIKPLLRRRLRQGDQS